MFGKIVISNIKFLKQVEHSGDKIEEKLEIARNLLYILDNEAIAQKTGLGIEEIKRLREKI